MTSGDRSWGVALEAAVIGLVVGGVGTQLLLPFLREVDPLGLTPIALVSVIGGAALGWYLRGCAQARAKATGPASA